MKNIHLVTPFMRAELKDTLISAYRPMGVIWHPIMFADEVVDFETKINPWIVPSYIIFKSTDITVKMPGNYKRNQFIKNVPIIDDDYYVTVDDDDMYEPDVFGEIRKMDDDIVIISMKRGHHIPEGATAIRQYPTSTLIASPDNICVGSISAQQSFVKGKIFKQHLFNEDNHCWDGEIAIHHKESGEQIAYRPDLFALFNFYELGRWNHKPDLKISFGVMINDAYRFNTVLKKSSLPGEVIFVIDPESATKGLNQILDKMEAEKTDVAILVHQDMYFRQGWYEKVKSQIAKLPENWMVAGIIGKDMQGRMCGKLHDMRIVDHINSSAIHTFPEPACCFDECVIIINMKHGYRFDEDLDGFDLYGTLCVLQAWERGLTAWVIDAWAEHYCMRSFGWWPGEDFQARYKKLYDKYLSLTEKIDSTVFVSQPRFETSAAPMDEAA